MMHIQEMLDVVAQISYPGFRFVVIHKSALAFLVIECPDGKCSEDGTDNAWRGRKWYLSEHMTRSEIVQTAFKAVLTALEHEARENFKFRDVPVLDPHLDLDNLALVRSERAPMPA